MIDKDTQRSIEPQVKNTEYRFRGDQLEASKRIDKVIVVNKAIVIS